MRSPTAFSTVRGDARRPAGQHVRAARGHQADRRVPRRAPHLRRPHRGRRARVPGLTPRWYLVLLFVKGAVDGSERASFAELAARLKLNTNTVTELVAPHGGGGPACAASAPEPRPARRLPPADRRGRAPACRPRCSGQQSRTGGGWPWSCATSSTSTTPSRRRRLWPSASGPDGGSNGIRRAHSGWSMSGLRLPWRSKMASLRCRS